MKQVLRFCLAVVLFVSFVPMKVLFAASGDGGFDDYELNLIDNGSFEAIPEQPGSIAGWDTWSSGEDAKVVVDSPIQEGNPVLKIQAVDIPVKGGISEVHQWVDLAPGQPYQFTADVLFESATNTLVTMRIDFYDDTLDWSAPNLEEAYIAHSSQNLNEAGNVTIPLSITGDVPEDARYAKVEFDIVAAEANASGTAYFDNAKLVYLWAPTHLTLTDRTETSISMAWDKPIYGDEYVYEVYRLTKDGDVKLGETASTSFTWTVAPPLTSRIDAVTGYSFYVKAKLYSDTDLTSWPTNIIRAATQKPKDSITIMTLGDSITYGYMPENDYPGGYRGGLWRKLQSKHPNVLFVGTMEDNPSSDADFDPDHEGHPGYRVHKIAELVDSEVAAYTPDYLLLMDGTNDMWYSDNEAAHYMRTTLEKIAATESLQNTYVILSSIPNIYLNNPEIQARIDQYNKELETIVGEQKAAGMNIGFIDMNAMLNESYFTYPGTDYFHPDSNGYNVMAEVWYDALDAAIDTGDVSGRFPMAPVLNDPVLIENNTAVSLSWQEPYDNSGYIDRYKIYMNDVEKTSVTGSTYGVVSNLEPSKDFFFSVVAVDKAGNESPVSNTVTVRTPDPAEPDLSPPTAPSDLQAIGVSHNSVTLSWVPGIDDVGIRDYEIRYGGTAVSVTNIVYGSDRITYEVTGLSPVTRYDFDVRAIDYSGNVSDASAPLSVETKAAPPSGLQVSAKTTTSVTLSWTAPQGVKAYRIYQGESQIAETDQTSFTVGDLTPGQTYKFQVAAVDMNNIETPRTVELSVKMEFQAPGVLVMTANTEYTIDMKWSKVGGASGYAVYIDGNRIATTTENVTTYHAEGLKPGTKYNIAIQSLFGEGLQSEIGEAVEMETKKLPPPPAPVGGGFFFPPSVTEPKYETTDKGIKMTYAPNKDEALKSINGSDPRLTVNIPSGKPFDLLQLELDGEVLKLAANKKKPVVIRMGSLALELTPGWLNVADKDKVTFTIVKKSLEGNKASISQSLKPLSDSYDLTVVRNGEKVTSFTQPVRLSVTTKEKPESGVTGIYLWDNAKGTWTSLGGTVDASGNVSLDLTHFSEYAVFTAVKAKTFADITNHWARKEIESLAARQIVSGVTSDRFNPSGEVTRAEFAAMLARAFNLKPPAERPPFDDIKEGSWYYNSIAAAYEAGWIQGVGGGKFAPSNRITREEMAVMIWKAYAYARGGSAGQEASTSELKFADTAKISKWAVEAVEQATTNELIYGMNGSFKPELYADRAQAAVMISRILDKTDIR